MKHPSENIREAAAHLIREIDRLVTKPVRLMEVCGTHTVAIFKAGIRHLLPPQVELVSGPGCPVCVTPHDFLDTAIAYSRRPDVILTTFGDMLRVPGSSSSLSAEKAAGADIRVVYSPLESLDIARAHPEKKVIFLAVGFETTAPTAAATVLTAEKLGLNNFYLLSAHKLVPPALRALLTDQEAKVTGFLLPGHVSAVIGIPPYHFLAEEYQVPAVIAGFEPLDILQAVWMLAQQIHSGRAAVENQYTRVVPPEGNPRARQVLAQVYETTNVAWRGLGVIPGSGLQLNPQYRSFDALTRYPIQVEKAAEPAACRCGEVLRGRVKPSDCLLFGKACIPEHPVGSCMVSVEGTCAAWYKYGTGRWQI
ncbi:hydrogenase formation protein HypD [Candidatus Formimonas warabiya]|uniref:Hydrogenase formation protein HypD n=1 Tax=Formimonas warabiya TaxID=1761012 RepID=A0A3G1L1A1_FORW1|nr:hydrogenase formation protein HypD [Candidatus Formimonas warabiya]